QYWSLGRQVTLPYWWAPRQAPADREALAVAPVAARAAAWVPALSPWSAPSAPWGPSEPRTVVCRLAGLRRERRAGTSRYAFRLDTASLARGRRYSSHGRRLSQSR